MDLWRVKTADDQGKYVEPMPWRPFCKDDASNPDVADYARPGPMPTWGRKQEKTGDPDFQSKARPFYDKAIAVFDGAIAREPKNALLDYRYFKMLLAIDRSLADRTRRRPRRTCETFWRRRARWRRRAMRSLRISISAAPTWKNGKAT